MRKIILSLLLLITIFPIASIGQSTQYIVGTPNGSNTGTTYPAPFANWYWGTRQQYLILASELTALGAVEGNIKEIAFNVLALGAVQTEMLAEAFPDYQASLQANEMANYIYNFAISGNKFYNGKVLQVSNTTP